MDVKINNPEDARPTKRSTASAATAAIDAAGSRKKPLTEADIRKRHEKGLKELNTELTEALSRKFLGEKIAAEIVNGATGDVLVPANKKITKALLVALARSRADATVEPGPVAEQLKAIFDSFDPKFASLGAKRDAELAELAGGPEAAAETVRSVKVYLAEKKNLSVGDKLSGRHGNKGVVARILPDCDMPFLPNGQPMDIVLNPMGVPSRMNLGQVFETHLGAACRALGKHAGTPVFDGIREESPDKASDFTRKARAPYEETIRHMLHEAGLQKDFEWIKEDGKSVLYDGRTGEPFDQRVMVGVTYMLKLHHLVTDKIHARAVGPYSLVTQQPLGGKAQAGGQRMGEMEVWALEAYGVAYALQELLTVKSDDVAGRTRIYESIVKGQNVLQAGMPESFSVLMNELRGLCLDMQLKGRNTGDESEKDALSAPAVVAPIVGA
jgi:DNA-directed RNA polymerase subunit beta